MEEDVSLAALLQEHAVMNERTGGILHRIKSSAIIPDTTNREYTGLSLEHVHYIANNISNKGFLKRNPYTLDPRSHDIPVLIMEKREKMSANGEESLTKWRKLTEEKKLFPPIDESSLSPTFYCSLGNGHFSQALNLFRHQCINMFTGQRYQIVDGSLRLALDYGIDSIVLSADTPLLVRKKISLLLNNTHSHARFYIDENNHRIVEELFSQASSTSANATTQFEALSKVLDSFELAALVRTQLKLDFDNTTGSAVAVQNKSKL